MKRDSVHPAPDMCRFGKRRFVKGARKYDTLADKPRQIDSKFQTALINKVSDKVIIRVAGGNLGISICAFRIKLNKNRNCLTNTLNVDKL